MGADRSSRGASIAARALTCALALLFCLLPRTAEFAELHEHEGHPLHLHLESAHAGHSHAELHEHGHEHGDGADPDGPSVNGEDCQSLRLALPDDPAARSLRADVDDEPGALLFAQHAAQSLTIACVTPDSVEPWRPPPRPVRTRSGVRALVANGRSLRC